jgi:hypothetical protein
MLTMHFSHVEWCIHEELFADVAAREGSRDTKNYQSSANMEAMQCPSH